MSVGPKREVTSGRSRSASSFARVGTPSVAEASTSSATARESVWMKVAREGAVAGWRELTKPNAA